MITIPHATEAIRMQGFQTHTAIQPISIQPLQTQQKPRVTEVRHNAEKHSLFMVSKAFLAGIVFGPRHSYLKIKNLSAHVTGTDERIW